MKLQNRTTFIVAYFLWYFRRRPSMETTLPWGFHAGCLVKYHVKYATTVWLCFNKKSWYRRDNELQILCVEINKVIVQCHILVCHDMPPEMVPASIYYASTAISPDTRKPTWSSKKPAVVATNIVTISGVSSGPLHLGFQLLMPPVKVAWGSNPGRQISIHLWPPLLPWIDFNPSMDK